MTDANVKRVTMVAIITRAAGRRKAGTWVELISLVMEFLGPLLENCFDNQASFVEAVSEPNRFQLARMQRDILKGLRRDRIGHARYRAGRACQIVDDLCSEATEASPEELALCFAELD